MEYTVSCKFNFAVGFATNPKNHQRTKALCVSLNGMHRVIFSDLLVGFGEAVKAAELGTDPDYSVNSAEYNVYKNAIIHECSNLYNWDNWYKPIDVNYNLYK